MTNLLFALGAAMAILPAARACTSSARIATAVWYYTLLLFDYALAGVNTTLLFSPSHCKTVRALSVSSTCSVNLSSSNS